MSWRGFCINASGLQETGFFACNFVENGTIPDYNSGRSKYTMDFWVNNAGDVCIISQDSTEMGFS